MSFEGETPLRSGLRVLALGFLSSVIILAVSFVVLRPLTQGRSGARQLQQIDLPMQRQNEQLRVTLNGWQLFVEPELDAIQAGGAVLKATDIAKGAGLAQAQINQAAALVVVLRRNGLTSQAGALTVSMAALSAAITRFTPVASGAHVTPVEFAAVVADERRTFAVVWNLTSGIETTVSHGAVASDVQKVADKFGTSRMIVAVVGALNLLLAVGAASVLALRTARRQRAESLATKRRLYGADLQEALELSKSETAAYSIVGRALRAAVPQLDVELLIADSSRAHFHRVLDNHDESDQSDGCGVVSPEDCPATARGHTMLFPSSDALERVPTPRRQIDRPLVGRLYPGEHCGPHGRGHACPRD